MYQKYQKRNCWKLSEHVDSNLQKPLQHPIFTLWAGNKVAMWRTADPHTWVQIPPCPLQV